jgi:hypothetical protein
VVADDDAVAPSDDRLDEAELLDAARDGVQLLVADAPRVGGAGSETLDRYVFDGQVVRGGDHGVTSLADRGAAVSRLVACGAWER